MYNKILTFGFDDCEIYDRNLAELFRKYNIKATFFLISDQLGFTCPHHRYGEDIIVERVHKEELSSTYEGMEIASHTCNHYFDEDRVEEDIILSQRNLSELCGYEVKGFAYPGGVYNKKHIKALADKGVLYARTASCTNGFSIPNDFLEWHPTCSYDDPKLESIIDEFLNYSGQEPILLYIFGHSYEFTRNEEEYNFQSFEKALQKLCNRKDIWYATNMEIAEKYAK